MNVSLLISGALTSEAFNLILRVLAVFKGSLRHVYKHLYFKGENNEIRKSDRSLVFRRLVAGFLTSGRV